MPDQDLYRQYCKEANERILSNNEAFDKAILTLSSAGLGLSLTFFKFVVPLNEAVDIHILERGWYLFLAAIISTVLSFFVSQQAQRKGIDHAEKYYLEDLEEYENKNNPAANLTEFLNFLSALFFIIALGCVVGFVTVNL